MTVQIYLKQQTFLISRINKRISNVSHEEQYEKPQGANIAQLNIFNIITKLNKVTFIQQILTNSTKISKTFSIE